MSRKRVQNSKAVDGESDGDGDGDGFSDDSSFYGDAAAKSALEARAASYDPLEYWQRRDRDVQRWAAVAAAAAARSGGQATPRKEVKRNDADDEDDDDDDDGETASTVSSSASVGEVMEGLEGPDSAEIKEGCGNENGNGEVKVKDEVDDSKTTGVSTSTTTSPAHLKQNPHEQPDTSTPLLYNPYEGDQSARQLSEPLTSFLTRLPPSTTTLSQAGPWISIADPHSTYRPLTADIATFKSQAQILLSNHLQTTKQPKPGRHRYSASSSAQSQRLTTSLLSLSRTTHLTLGKWLLFVPTPLLDVTWSTIATATLAGDLGCAAKVATISDTYNNQQQQQQQQQHRLICIYTSNFDDRIDIKRVLNALRNLGVVGGERGGKQMYYKPEAWSYLGITSGNEWGIKASLYSSGEF